MSEITPGEPPSKGKLETRLQNAARVLHLRDGTVIKGRIVMADKYNLLIAASDGAALWVPKHAVMWAELAKSKGAKDAQHGE